MAPKFTYMILAAGFAVSVVGSAMAEDKARVLRVTSGVCPEFKETLFDWAGSTEGHGTYAAPALPLGSTVDCDDPSNIVPTSIASGYSDQKAADFAAMSHCESNLPEGFSRCVIVGQSFDK